MEPWREEALSDELMHYGIKGMKWKKRKKKGMSDLERAARTYESISRARASAYKNTVDRNGVFSDRWSDKDRKHLNNLTKAENNALGNLRKKYEKKNSKINNLKREAYKAITGRGKERLLTGYNDENDGAWRAYKIKKGRGGIAVTKMTPWLGGARYTTFIPKEKNEVQRFVSNLFKKKKKR